MSFLDLIVVRHAQAVEGSFSMNDSERRLTPQGERDASALGRLRRQLHLPEPQIVFTSGYERAEQTLERVLEGLVLNVVRDMSFSPEGSVAGAWELIKKQTSQAERSESVVAWVFGHNPNIERLLALIAPDLAQFLRPFRKATLAWLRISEPPGHGREVQLVTYIPSLRAGRTKNSLSDL
ncbi:MAG: hypothetical protein RIR26_610 [Pseudomonadota bacterium]|jgi:phosphohistidine phosphatase